MHRPRVLVERISSTTSTVGVDSADAHHLARVLRLRVGDQVGVFDGSGREWLGRLTTLGGSSATIELTSEVAPMPEPPVTITIAIGVLKGDQMDHAVRDATALGAAEIVPMTTAHVTVPARAWTSGAALDRWRRVAVAAVKQCGRARLPEVRPVVAFEDLIAATKAGRTYTRLCLPSGRGVETTAPVVAVDPDPAPPADALVLIGPEGGWSPDEIDHALAAGARPLHLGPRILRAELAPAIALASLWTRWGW